jgi:hypothetical protein
MVSLTGAGASAAAHTAHTSNQAHASSLTALVQLYQELGGGWCVDVYKWQGRWLSRAYQKGKRGPKPGVRLGREVRSLRHGPLLGRLLSDETCGLR